MLALVAACVAVAWPDASTVVPRNGGHPTGDPVWARVFLVCAGAATVAYAAGVWLLSRHGASLRVVAVLAVAIQFAPLAAPLLLSTDAWTYWAYGRVAAVHGESPYERPPEDFPDDPALPWMGADWRDRTSAYGPAFTLASVPVALVAGRSEEVAAWTFKLLAAAAMTAAALLAARLAERKTLALALAGWNPVLAVHAAGGGHNDAWVGALVLAALALAASGRRRLAGAAWALAALVKWVPLVFLVLRGLEARAAGRRVSHAGFAVTAVLVAGAATVLWGLGWLGALGPLAENVAQETSYALPARLGLPGWVGVAAFALAFLWLARQALAGRARLGLAAVLLLLTTPYLTPWYLAWTVPLAAAEEDRTARVLAVALSLYLVPQTIPA
ncbi:MAG TPA: glycosyltransferase 87 family protein [Gaiellaceae bacterium]|nr:glycosyltransferase 87 family protein [Gaiellaceae bacterium]